MRSMAPTTGLFANRDYLRLFTAQVSGLFGTGLTTVALGLLAYELAGAAAAAVLGTALTIKMVVYVTVAPIVGAYAHRLPRRTFLTALHLMRAGVVLALPFIAEIWQIYLLIAVLQTASAAYTPTYQAVIPDILPRERDYTRALSAAQLAATMETLLSPMLAAAALLVVSFHWLFAGTAAGFVIAALLVVATRIPDATAAAPGSFRERITVGVRLFAATPRLRGLLGLNLVVAAAGSVVMVNTVNYVRDTLGGAQSGVAMLLAANGFGTMLVALALPRILDRTQARPVMLTGAATLVTGLAAAIALSTAGSGEGRWAAALAVWALIGAGTAAVLTPTGQVLRGSASPADRPALFAAQFSLSHLAWLITYPITGWLTTTGGFTITWIVLAAFAVAGIVVAQRMWPRGDADALDTQRVEDQGTRGAQRLLPVRPGVGTRADIDPRTDTQGRQTITEDLGGGLGHRLQDHGIERVAHAVRQVRAGRDAVAAPHVHGQPAQQFGLDGGVVAAPRGITGRTPHIVEVEVALVPQGQAHRFVPQREGRVHVAGKRTRETELVAMMGGQGERGIAAHGRADDRIVGAGDAVPGEEGRQFLGEEGLPPVGDGLAIGAARPVPVGVEAGVPADREHESDVVPGELAQGVGVRGPLAVIGRGA